MLRDNILVGFGMTPDLTALGIEHFNKEELQDFYYELKENPNNPDLMIQEPYKLKDLATHFFGKSNFQCGFHSAIHDARVTRDLYFKKLEIMKNESAFHEKVVRSPKFKYVFDPTDVCNCSNVQ